MRSLTVFEWSAAHHHADLLEQVSAFVMGLELDNELDCVVNEWQFSIEHTTTREVIS